MGIKSESEDKKEKVKVQSKEDLSEGLSQETSGHSHGSNLSSDVTNDRVDPSNHVDHDFSVSLPIVSQSANLPMLSDLLSKETVGQIGKL